MDMLNSAFHCQENLIPLEWFMDSVTVLTTQKEKIASVAKQVLMTDHGDLQLLKTPTNVEGVTVMAMLRNVGLILLCLLHLVMLAAVSVSAVYTTLSAVSVRSVNHFTFRILARTSGNQILVSLATVIPWVG